LYYKGLTLPALFASLILKFNIEIPKGKLRQQIFFTPDNTASGLVLSSGLLSLAIKDVLKYVLRCPSNLSLSHTSRGLWRAFPWPRSSSSRKQDECFPMPA